MGCGKVAYTCTLFKDTYATSYHGSNLLICICLFHITEADHLVFLLTILEKRMITYKRSII